MIKPKIIKMTLIYLSPSRKTTMEIYLDYLKLEMVSLGKVHRIKQTMVSKMTIINRS
jgi:hypothetical protein